MVQTNNPNNDEVQSFIQMLKNYESVFPDALLMHIMHRSGVSKPSEAAARTLGIAAQKFVSDIINDALALTELREDAKGGITNRETFILTQDLVKEVLSHRFADSFH
uniref:Transcription initiation factor TFIID subunit 10 n=1 Tax=Panagrolaimus davidi TaxID=227884 RepID=A0A914PH35_9BILA